MINMSKCEHNRRKDRCKECGGSAICEHNRRRITCKECGGSQICEHNRLKNSCKDCGGSQICEHNTVRSKCTECGGGGICEHNKRRSRCIECGGSEICEHNRHKEFCKECGGSQICEHNIIKNTCRECGGSKFCEHNRIKGVCKECGGTQICEHNRRKNMCKECGGNQICEHNRNKYFCKECGGNGICEHNIIKTNCIHCSPEIACENCKHNIRSTNKTYKPYCFACYCVLNPDIEIKRRFKVKETHLQEALIDYNFINDKTIEGGCSKRRPDFLLDLLTHGLIVECDEHCHQGYSTTCEIAKLNDTFSDLADRPLVILRFNPDKFEGKSCYDGDGKLIKTEWNKRTKVLKERIDYWLRTIPEDLITTEYLYYK